MASTYLWRVTLFVALVTISYTTIAQDILYGLTRYGGQYNKGVPYQIRVPGIDYLSYKDFDGKPSDRPGYWSRLTQLAPILPPFTIGNSFVGLTEYGNIATMGGDVGSRFDFMAGSAGIFQRGPFYFGGDAGTNPTGGLVTAFGKLYGTIHNGGSNGNGALYSTEQFAGPGQDMYVEFEGPVTGRSPKGTPILASNGLLYGTTEFGGANDAGVIYAFSRNNGLSKILDFGGAARGANPTGDLVLASDNRLYGMTNNGGATGNGVIFSVALDGSDFRKLMDFNGTNGAHPAGSLVEFSDGKLYGMTRTGGALNLGTVFSITRQGQYTKIADLNGSNGQNPYGDLLVSTNGSTLYGVTYAGGTNGVGVLFKVSGGVLTKVFDFDAGRGSNPVGTLSMVRKFPAVKVEELTTVELSKGAFTIPVEATGSKVFFASDDLSTVEVTGDQFVPKKIGGVRIKLFQLGNAEYIGSYHEIFVNVIKSKQTIEFAPLPEKKYHDAPLTLTAAATSGLPVSFYSSNPDIASIEDNVLTIKNAGITYISAVQQGDDTFEPAEAVIRTLYVNKIDQTISVQPIGKKLCCDYFTVSATTTSGLTLEFEGDNTKVTTNGNLVTPTAIGTSEIRVSQPGNHNYNPAEAKVSVEVGRGFQLFNFQIPAEARFGDGVQYANVISGGGQVTVTSNPSGIAVVENNRLYILGVGTTTLTARQEENENYFTATPVIRTITVKPPAISPTDNVITWSEFSADRTLADLPFSLLASASSGLPISYTSSDPNVATIAGNQVTLKSLGVVTITATQAGATGVPAASNATRTITVTKKEQFVPISMGTMIFMDNYPPQFSPTSSEGLPVTYEVSDPEIATIENYRLNIKGSGFVTVTASQAGNNQYLPAINSVTTQIIPAYRSVSVAALPLLTYGDGPVTLKGHSESALPIVFSSSDPQVAEVQDGKLIIHNAGQFVLSAALSSTAFTSEVTYPIEVHKAAQQLTVKTVPAKKFGDAPFKLEGTATSGLPLNAVAQTPGVVSITNNVTSIIGSGVAHVRVEQPGNQNYAAASVSLEFEVTDADKRFVITGTALEGAAGNSGTVYSIGTDGGPVDHIKQYPDRKAPNPAAGFIKASDGKFYGLFRRGGSEDGGQLVVMNDLGTGVSTVYEFKRQSGYFPVGNLFEGADGFLYGVTTTSNDNVYGNLFKVAKDGSGFSVVYKFSSLSGGAAGGVIQGTNGRLYGTTGAVFSVNTDGSDFRILHNFTPSFMPGPSTTYSNELVQGPDGALYGTLMFSGTDSNGSVYKINTDGTAFTILVDFNDGATGIRPAGKVMFASDGRIYGTTAGGGASGNGSIYSVLPSGGGFTQLHSFVGGSGGAAPYCALVEGSDGKLYGTTNSGGPINADGILGNGIIFSIAKNGTGFTKVVDLDDRGTRPEHGPLVEAEPGVFYGTAQSGGALNSGAVFKVTSSGTLDIFCFCAQGEYGPRELIEDPSGTYLYGVTRALYWNEGGSIFRIRKDNRAYEKIVDVPVGDIISTIFYASTGHLWVAGNTDNVNFIYRINPDGTNRQPIVAYNDPANQQMPPTSFVESPNGAMFGLSPNGHYGPMIFSIRNDGTGYHSLQYLGYNYLSQKLLLASDGNVYVGYNQNSIYRFTPDGTGSEIYELDLSTGDGITKIIEMNDGRLGITSTSNSSAAKPTVFSIEKDGSGFRKILAIEYGQGSYPVDMEQAIDGWLYVSSKYDGDFAKGMLFKIRPDGSGYTAIHHFDAADAALPENFMFDREAQNLTFSAIPDQLANAPAFFPEITTSSGAAVVLTSSHPEVASIEDGLVVTHKKGSAVITARLPANANYYDGGSASQTLVVIRGNQTITFDPLEERTLTPADFELTASTSSGLPLTFVSSNPAIASIDGSTVHLHATGSVTITASQPGNDDFFPATAVSQTLTIVSLKQQTITFSQPADKVVGITNPFSLMATTTSGLPVTFSTVSESIAIDGTTVEVLLPGQAIVVASQAGNAEYAPAVSVTRSFCINPLTPIITEDATMGELQLYSTSNEGNQWFFADVLIPGANASFIIPRKQGNYTTQVTIDGCRSEVSNPHLVVIMSVEEWASVVDVYPNPVAEKLSVNVGSEMTDAKVSLTNASGVPVRTIQLDAGGNCEIDMGSLTAGMYVLQIEHKGKVNSYKVLKQ